MLPSFRISFLHEKDKVFTSFVLMQLHSNHCKTRSLEEVKEEHSIVSDILAEGKLQTSMKAVQGLLSLEGSSWEPRPAHPISNTLQVHTAQWRPEYRDFETYMRHPTLAFKEWQRQHLGLLEPARLQAPRLKHYCHQQGACTCKARGLKIGKAHLRLQQHLKAVLDKDSLLDGFTIVEIWDDTAAGPANTVFGHIALQYLSPLCSILFFLKDDEHRQPQRAGNKVFQVNVEGGWITALEYLERCDYRNVIRARLWTLWESGLHKNRPFSAEFVEGMAVSNSTTTLWAGAQEAPSHQHKPSAHDDIAAGAGTEEAAEDIEDAFLETPLQASSVNDEVGSMIGASTTSSSSSSSTDSSDTDSSDVELERGGEDANVVADTAPPPPPAPPAAPPAPPPPHQAEPGPLQDGLPIHNEGQPTGMSLRYHGKTNDMYVTCNEPGHNVGSKCSLTRTCNPTAKRKPQQGRPLGFIAAWAAASSKFPSKAEHMAFKLSFQERRAARDTCKNQPQAVQFLRYEREKREGEESEPDECP